ncbi:MAG TPA: hypothetical protein VIK11_14485 [Tepidiformaceae bacterium]|jgi:hypothetical protein
MTDRIETHSHYADTKAFRLHAREMKADGWSVAEAHFVRGRRGILGDLAAGIVWRRRTVEVLYLRSGREQQSP